MSGGGGGGGETLSAFNMLNRLSIPCCNLGWAGGRMGAHPLRISSLLSN